MILREPKLTRDDCRFIAECVEDWPDSDRGPVYDHDVRYWITQWAGRDREKGLIGEVEGKPVGFIIYMQRFFCAMVYQIAVHPSHRGQGHGKGIWGELQDILRNEGVVVCEFEAPRYEGSIVDKLVDSGRFEKIGEGVGLHTGLPTVRGRVFADTPIA